jgi:hypothetical protein
MSNEVTRNGVEEAQEITCCVQKLEHASAFGFGKCRNCDGKGPA